MFYTSLHDAYRELEIRRKDQVLIKKVRRFLGSFNFDPLSSPHAVISRPIATPNFELEAFLEKTSHFSLEPLVLEYPSKLVTRNKDKYHACVMHFSNNVDEAVAHNATKMKIVDIPQYEGKDIVDIKTVNDISLIDFHHSILNERLPEFSKPGRIVDFTKWFNQTRNLTDYYYLYYLSLFIYQGVLFENFFLKDPAENDFIFKKIIPSFKQVIELFGVRPLIVPLLISDPTKANQWLYYPNSVREIIKQKYAL